MIEERRFGRAALVFGSVLLAVLCVIPGCTERASAVSTETDLIEDEHQIAYSVWLDGEHTLIIQNSKITLSSIGVGDRPPRLLSGDSKNQTVQASLDGVLVSIGGKAVESSQDFELPSANMVGWFSAGAIGFDREQMRVWQWDNKTEDDRTIFDRQTLIQLLGETPDFSKHSYLDRLAVSPSGSMVALTIPGSELLYDQSEDWTSEVVVLSEKGEKATRLGLGMPLFWLDEKRIVVWNIERDDDGQRHFVARLFNSDGQLLAEQDQVGSIAWNGRNLYIVRAIPEEGYSRRLDRPEVEVWDENMERQVSSFRLHTSFVNAYSSNFIAFKN